MKERLLYINNELKRMKALYIERGIPLKIYEDSLSDVHYRLARYKKNNGKMGISEWDLKWLQDVFDAKFFDLGVLRFQIFEMDYSLIERSGPDLMPLIDEIKQRFPEGNYYINVHIVQGADLDPEKVAMSFKFARQFFKQYFPEYQFDYFICRTWLLDESLLDLLPAESKIIKFRNQFEILARNDHKAHGLLRIYGSDDLEEISKMDHQTSLQKRAYLHEDKLGVSFGCIPF